MKKKKAMCGELIKVLTSTAGFMDLLIELIEKDRLKSISPEEWRQIAESMRHMSESLVKTSGAVPSLCEIRPERNDAPKQKVLSERSARGTSWN